MTTGMAGCDKDKTEIRRWLDWGRKHVEYLKVSRISTDPAPGKVDGSAHVIGNRGLVFLFNPDRKPLDGQFALTGSRSGCAARGLFASASSIRLRKRTCNSLLARP